MAGEVIAIGEDVKQWKIGDRVAAKFFLDKVNDVQTAETDQSALGGAIQGVLTEYRSYPSHVCFSFLSKSARFFLNGIFDLSSRSSPSRPICLTRRHQPFRAWCFAWAYLVI
jgi:hypothetical protein